MQLNCNMEGFNGFGVSCGAKARIGIIANNEIGCGYCPDPTIGFGIGGDLAVSNSRCGSAAAYGQDADNGGRDLKAMEYILVHWGGGGHKFLYRKALPPRSNPLPFYAPFFTKKVPLSVTFY